MSLPVTVSSLAGETVLSVELQKTDTVLVLKKSVQEACGQPVCGMKLVWNSTVLQPNHAELGQLAEEATEINATLVKLATRRVYFEGVSWKGHGRPTVSCGISAPKDLEEDDQMTNAADQEAFLRHVVDEGVKFESVEKPGLFICASGDRVILGKPDDNNEIFHEIPARNGAPEPCTSLESHSKPDHFLVHCNGDLWIHSMENKMQWNDDVFNDDASWRFHDCEVD
eukprot:TRINITY_DN68926_c0_g1_i1.p1 TRINITY_DN68926_c0_g1~~TRINITY_DN68926_c0_g1_i1.p1  ORF type:complete len:226 (-),score=41.08 TRINITY_DN68926_c0_g1_i1:324-1001(-)